VKCSWVKCSEGLSNRLSNVIQNKLIIWSLLLICLFRLSHSFIFFWFHFFYHCIYGCIFCVLLFNFVNYVFLFLCLFILTVMYVPFCTFCFNVLFCVQMWTVLLPRSANPGATDKYIKHIRTRAQRYKFFGLSVLWRFIIYFICLKCTGKFSKHLTVNVLNLHYKHRPHK